MKRSLIAFAFSLSLIAPNAFAFDFGSLLQQAAPVTDAVVANTSVGSNPLVKNLTTSLGVTPTQAIGGSAALFGEAKKDMKPADFQSLTSSIPAIGSIMAAAPASTSPLTTQFAKLGLKPEMVGKFTPFLLDYVKSGTTPAMGNLVAAALQ
ncbi:MAG: DUF2780 domain-containing protein [Sulfuricurvum sp.]|nr:DUF2780 domain-containing protein [Sulfuricurvum sp.]